MTKKYTISGIVQGIGFRPNVKRAAQKHGVKGYVKNLGGAVEIAAKGGDVQAFREEIKSLPQSLITSFHETDDADIDYDSFDIIESGIDSGSVPVLNYYIMLRHIYATSCFSACGFSGTRTSSTLFF